MKAFATGEVITLTEVNDGVFSAGIMGDGFAMSGNAAAVKMIRPAIWVKV